MEERKQQASPWWDIREQQSTAVQQLAEAAQVPGVIAALLLCKGIQTKDAVHCFLHPQLSDLHDPYKMHGMPLAVERLRKALRDREPILIYGDYDVDGTIATVLLKVAAERAALSMGVPADIRYHIPHRLREGYGMQSSRIEAAALEGVRLVVSVDTGIRAFAAAEEARRLGLDLIVTDHHLPDETHGVPAALAVLNPNQPQCEYPYKELCGAGVAFKLAQALLESAASSPDELTRLRSKTLPSFLKLLSIATIADAVPLTGENRVIAHIGLQELRRPAQHGLRALMELAAIDPTRPISATDVGYRLAPRINAAGRMDIASDVVDMFLTRDPAIARTLAEKLHTLNDERRATEAEALREIEERIAKMADGGLPACIVLDDEAWHRGVIGILASRVVDRTGRPALVLTYEDDQAYGSGRSISQFHLLDALTGVHAAAEPQLFTRFGGHAHAVGFSLPSDRVAELRKRMAAFAAERLTELERVLAIRCDARVAFSDLTPDFFNFLEAMEPFGQGNPEPLFLTCGLRLAAPIRFIKERHLRLTLEDESMGRRFGAMAWSRRVTWSERAEGERWTQGERFDVAYRLKRNWHPEFGGWEMEILTMHRAAN